MTKEELLSNSILYKHLYRLEYEPLPILKKDLVEGVSYSGMCRNADTAVWNGKVFTCKRYKFGDVFDEDINHFEDDDGYDVFVPFFEIVDED